MQSPLEAAKTALFNEMRARAFYDLAAETTSRDDARVLYMELSDLEREHAAELARRLRGQPFCRGFDPIAYVETLEGSLTATLSPTDEKVIREGDPKAVLKLAERLEIEARDDYRALAGAAEEPAVKMYYEELSRLEQHHFDELRKLELSIDMDPEARPEL